MTDQELYDTVAAHLLRQNAKSREGGHCRYRGPGGRKCAVGCLIPDEKYSDRFEGKSVNNENVLDATGCGRQQRSLLTQLQICHDDFEPREWPRQLVDIAGQFRLQPYARPVTE